MDDILDFDIFLEDAVWQLVKALKLHDGNDWSNTELWDDQWCNGTTIPARKLLISVMRDISKIRKLYAPDVMEANEMHKDYD